MEDIRWASISTKYVVGDFVLINECRIRVEEDHESPASPPPIVPAPRSRVKITPWRILNTAVLLVLGTYKAVSTYLGGLDDWRRLGINVRLELFFRLLRPRSRKSVRR